MLRALLLASLVALATASHAQPDLRKGRPAGPLIVYPDDGRSGLYYYPPGEIALATAGDGRPQLHFLQMRYTGSVVSADRGTTLFRSVLAFQVRLAGPEATQLKAAREALGAPGRIELRPLPIRRLDAALVYATAEPDQAANEQSLPTGHFEADTAGTSSSSAYWRERTYTLGLDTGSARLFWDALQKGQVVISLAYAFHADGIPPEQPLAELSGSPGLVAVLREQENAAATAGTGPTLVRAGATAIRVDAKRWPDLFRQVDINETVPPGYAALDVYCYDFNNRLRPDLVEKQVEIEAEGVGGRRIRLSTLFRQDQPDLYAHGLRFPLAVRLDRPYRYRVSAVDKEGNTVESPWQTRTSWSELLDVTSPPAEAKPYPPEEETR